jgi:hypothetical protein
VLSRTPHVGGDSRWQGGVTVGIEDSLSSAWAVSFIGQLQR